MLKHVIFFDLETTGTDVAADRIVQLAARKFDRQTLTPCTDLKKYLFNPGKPIPQEAIECHGITDEMVKDEPTFAKRAKAIHEFFQGCDVAGHNIIGFDIPLLAEEFDRCGIVWPEPDMSTYDTYIVFRDKEPRDLTAALKFYCGETLEDAHDAGNDLEAAHKVLQGQLKRYPEIEDMAAFHDISQGKEARVDLAGKIILNKDGDAVYSFGKGKGHRLTDDPGFGHWMLKQDFFTTNTKRVVRAIVGDPPVAQPYKNWKR